MTTRYHVSIDWDDDGTFDAPEETLDRDVIGLAWALGLADPADCLAAPSWATVTLRDPTGRYNPDHSISPLAGALVPRKRVRITAGTCALFTGWIESITPGHDRTVTLHCAGLETLLQRAEVFPPLLTNAPADAVIAGVLAEVDYPPALLGYWQLGLARLGQDTRLPDLTTYADLEPGRTTFAYAGDWPDGVSAWEALRTVVEAERGLCFVDSAGRVVFWNRHHLLYPRDPALTISGRTARFTTTVEGASMVNQAIVTCHPRAVSESGATLWTLHAPLRLPPGESRTFRARFGNDDGVRIGALALDTPQPGVDYTARDHRDGSGADRTDRVTFTATGAGSSALITATNHHTATVYLQPGARLRGSALRDSGPADAVVADRLSILHYGRRAVRLDLPLLSDLDDAAGVARFLVTEGSAPRSQVSAITLHNGGPDVLAATIGDTVQVAAGPNTHQHHSGRYHIVGLQHEVTRGGTDHTVTWVVRPAARLEYWRLGIAGAGELGTVTRVVY